MPSIRHVIATNELAPWVRDLYFQKSWSTLTLYMRPLEPTSTPREIVDSVGYTRPDPEGFRFHAEHDPRLNEAQREACREAATLAAEIVNRKGQP
jgi:hypothetical protein